MVARSFDIDQIRDYRPCWESLDIAQVLANLGRLNDRAGKGQSSQRRRCDRELYSAPVMVSQNRKVTLPDGSRALFHAIARNLSRSGLAVLAPTYFEPEIPCREAPLLQATTVFRDGALLEFGLRKPCGTLIWLYGTVIRVRIVQHDYLDIGVRFNARCNLVQELELES